MLVMVRAKVRFTASNTAVTVPSQSLNLAVEPEISTLQVPVPEVNLIVPLGVLPVGEVLIQLSVVFKSILPPCVRDTSEIAISVGMVSKSTLVLLEVRKKPSPLYSSCTRSALVSSSSMPRMVKVI